MTRLGLLDARAQATRRMDHTLTSASALLARLDLHPVQVYRDGPRFWVAHVRGQDEDYVLKVVIDDTPRVVSPTSPPFCASDQLRNELAILVNLGAHANRLVGNMPRVIASSSVSPTWILRTFTAGRPATRDQSPFLYHPRFYEDDYWLPMVDFVLSLQALSEDVAKAMPRLAASTHTLLAQKLEALGLADPPPPLAPLADRLAAWFAERQPLHDESRMWLSHGQMYPPHMFITEAGASVIDWENTCFSNRLQDMVSIWIRGHDAPGWQDRFYAEIERRGLLAENGSTLWDTEVMLQAAGNLVYSYWSQTESAEVRAEIGANMQQHILKLLAAR
jgi:aminoglycoside phosphotransferase (APT) family kinase protein